jgi:diguanylate cyclase (GGDEF)-like protein
MSPWLLSVLVESLVTLLFCWVLYYLRRSLTRRSLMFWLLLWIARGVLSVFALRYLADSERFAVGFFAPLLIAFALALVVIAVRLENQKEQIRALNEELARLRRQSIGQLDQDPLTGLMNRSALTRWIDEEHGFEGLVVVCDMDDFKVLNDLFGHLVGDEILHGVGHLISNSIRDEDVAFRWGGDEFVIFFRTDDRKLVEARMAGIEERLQTFHIRHHGQTTIRFSWGIAPTKGRPLRDSLADADRLMYETKRARRLNPEAGKAPASV